MVEEDDSHSTKLAFASKKEADAAATVAKSQYLTDANLKAYRCRECDLWHLTSSYDED